MRRILAWTWKEAREHAARLRLLVVAIPSLTLLAGWIWAESLTTSDGDEIAYAFAAGALVLHGLLIAASLFTSDVGEGATTPAQRLPGGLGGAFVAKCGLWSGSALLALVVGSLSAAGVLWLAGQPERAWAVLTPWSATNGEQQLAFAGEALVYSACVGVVAACARHPGTAVAAGTVLFGLLLGPVVLGWRADPRVFPMHSTQSLVLAGLMLGVLLAAVLVAWRIGRRRVASGWRAATLAGGVIVVLYGAGAVSAASSIERQRSLDPAAADWTLEHMHVGRSGRYGFVSVRREVPAWPAGLGEPSSSSEVHRVELATGVLEQVGRRGASLLFVPHGQAANRTTWREMGAPLHAHERIVVMQPQQRLEGLEMPYEVLWFDGTSGGLADQGLDGYPSPREVEASRRLARHASTARDDQGRTAWLYEGFLHRDGADPIGVPPLSDPFRLHFASVPSDDAWWVRFSPGSTAHLDRYLWIDATTGRHVVREQEPLPPAYPLTRGRLLVQRSATRDLRQATWQIVDVTTGESAPALGAPTGWPRTSWPACRLAGDRILRTSLLEGTHRLQVWDPVTGAVAPVLVPGLAPMSGMARVLGAEPRGRILLSYPTRTGEAWVLTGPDGREPRVVRTHALGLFYVDPIWLAPDGSVTCLAMSHNRGRSYVAHDRIVRIGPGVDELDVLFPKVKE